MVGGLAGIVLLPVAARAQTCPNPSALTGGEEGVLAHVRYLADDALEGRGVASAGERCAGAYIADVFRDLGLTPAGEDGSFFQSFDVRTGSEITGPGSLTISPVDGEGGNPSFAPSRDEWRPYGFSGSGEMEAALLYAGPGVTRHGQTAESLPAAEGRIVVVEAMTDGVPSGDLYADPHFKASVAQGRGAGALIILHDEGDLPDPAVEDRPSLRIPVVAVAGEAAEAFREAARQGATAHLQAETRPHWSPARNVVALLPGSDPDLEDEVIVVGAHYDHLGMGGAGSLAPGVREIHNGADDNASGTAALLEVARRLASGPAPRRPVLFVAFSGEERGLLGSGHFVAEPTVPLDDAVAMLNMDMVGRLRDNRLTVFGVGTAPEWTGLLEAANTSLTRPFELILSPDGYGPSDHSSFYGAGIPVLHFFTNTHAEYHRPEDDVATLDVPGLGRVAQLVTAVAGELAGAGTRVAVPDLSLVESDPPPPSEGGRGYGPYFGSIPDMSSQDYGVRLTGVREGSPAAAAGLEGGDVIVGFGGSEVSDIYTYTYALREMSPGDPVDVIVMREGRRLTLQAVLGERR